MVLHNIVPIWLDFSLDPPTHFFFLECVSPTNKFIWKTYLIIGFHNECCAIMKKIAIIFYRLVFQFINDTILFQEKLPNIYGYPL